MTEAEKSYINIAEEILDEAGEPLDLYDLFDAIIKRLEIKEKDAEAMLPEFYTELIGSAKFLYTGDNTWDLKRRQKTELWSKDGSFYNEYKEVYDEDLEARIEAQKKREQEHQEMLERRRQAEEEARQAAAEPEAPAEVDAPAEEEARPEPPETPEPAATEPEAPTVADNVKDDSDDLLPDAERFEDEEEPEEDEDTFEEDFDEEEYHDIMDQYEDEYDK